MTRAGEFQQPGAALLQRVAQASTLAIAGAGQVRQGFREQTLRGGDHGRGVARAVADDPGPTQQIEYIDSRRRACLRCNLLRPRGETGEQFGIDFERGGGDRGAKVQRALDFAAADGGGDRGSKIRFGGAEFLGQAAAQLEKSVIHGLQFPGQQSPGELPLASGKAGHATNHGGRR